MSPKAQDRFRIAVIASLAGIMGAVLAVAGILLSAGRKMEQIEAQSLRIDRLESRTDHLYESHHHGGKDE